MATEEVGTPIMEELSTQDAGLVELVTKTKEKMLMNFGLYPYLSRAMIQQGLGPGCAPALWDPILEGLVASEEVVIEEAIIPGAHNNLTRKVYHLRTFPYPPVTLSQFELLKSAL